MKLYNLAQTIIESLQGMNNSGSSKRATAFGFFILSAILSISYTAMYVYVVIKNTGSELHKDVESLMWPMFGTVVSTLLSALGITYFDKKLDTKKDVELKKAEVATDKKEEEK